MALYLATRQERGQITGFSPGVAPALAHRPWPATQTSLDDLGPLSFAPSASRLAHLLAPFDRRFHVVAAPLELAQDAFRGHLALEMLDGAFDAFVANCDLEGPTLD